MLSNVVAFGPYRGLVLNNYQYQFRAPMYVYIYIYTYIFIYLFLFSQTVLWLWLYRATPPEAEVIWATWISGSTAREGSWKTCTLS